MRVWLAVMLNDRKGISALEYAILAAGICGAVFTAVTAFGVQIGDLFTTLASDLKADMPT
jgi:Flp pilus assembly pilin Flp